MMLVHSRTRQYIFLFVSFLFYPYPIISVTHLYCSHKPGRDLMEDHLPGMERPQVSAHLIDQQRPS